MREEKIGVIKTVKFGYMGYQETEFGLELNIDFKDKSNHIIEMNRELQEKDEEIERLEKELHESKLINSSEALLNTSLSRKYQEAVKDIEFLTSYLTDDYDSSFDSEYNKVEKIKTKYGLDKKEG